MAKSIFFLVLCMFGVTSISVLSAPANNLKGYFWHVTDFHMDLNYSSHGDPASMCWMQSNQSFENSGIFGNYKCDSPYTLVQKAVSGMKDLGSEPDFILWTGDDKAHVPDVNFDRDIVLKIIQNITDTLNSTFPNVPVVPVLGNHDWFPTHQLPPKEDPLYEAIGNLWKPWIKDEGYETFKRGGYYTVVLPNNIRFIVLNTALYYKKNLMSSSNFADPGSQFEWFDNLMQNLSARNEKAYVTSHVPPGIFERHMMRQGFQWLLPNHNKKLVQLLVEHSASILGLFFAHHHTDSFRVLYNETNHPVNWMLIAPAVTPWNTTLTEVGPNNPGLRKFTYDPTSQKVITFEQFYLNLTKANEEPDAAKWELEYDAQKDFALGPEGITAETLNHLVQTFPGSNRTLFDRYYLYNSVSYEDPSNCDNVCKSYQYCVITNIDYDNFFKCNGANHNFKGNNISCLFLAVFVVLISNAIIWFWELTT